MEEGYEMEGRGRGKTELRASNFQIELAHDHADAEQQRKAHAVAQREYGQKCAMPFHRNGDFRKENSTNQRGITTQEYHEYYFSATTQELRFKNYNRKDQETGRER